MAKKQRKAVPAKRRPRRRIATGNSRQPVLEAFSVMVRPAPGRDGLVLARRVARRVGLGRWRVEPVVDNGTEVEIVPPGRTIGTARAWDLAYALRDQPEVAHAEPMFRYMVPEMAPTARRLSGSAGVDDPATDREYDWSLRKANVLSAWRLFGPRPPGADVRVGHPDTGYTRHPELAEAGRLMVSAGYDYNDDDPDPTDDLNDGLLANPGHGTGTGSVILSGVGAAGGGPGPFVSGAAPHALLIPIRTTNSVVLFSMRGLRQAVDHAATHGAQVVSISLGGPFAGFGLHRAVQRAVDAGTIVLAAAGNEVRVVVFPALFDEVIAVAASNIRDEPWVGSSHGDAVDITAPGESVWRAKTVRDKTGQLSYPVERGNGTSFAVATVAGIAALWISFHGWPTLVRKYGAGNIARVFKQMLQDTCRTPRGWNAGEYGPGIVDAAALLETTLPDAAPARKLRDAQRAAVAADATGIEMLVHLMPDTPRTRVEAMVADLLQVSDRELPSILQDYGDELAFHLVMQPALLETLKQGARARQAAGPARAAMKRRLDTAGLSSRLRRQLRRR